MELASQHRHKYCGSNAYDENANGPGGWTKAGQAESQPDIERRIYVHPESPATGAHWMQHTINFNKLKVTNNAADRGSNVLLTSMHKYVPRIWIFQSDRFDSFSKLCSRPQTFFTFKETEFIAVTAYQNDQITKLKINNNPFAKGFRETGHSRAKRKYSDMSISQSGQTDGEDSTASSESSSPSGRTTTTAMPSRTDVLYNDASIGAVDEIKLLSPMMAPVQDLSSGVQNNSRDARLPVPLPRPHKLHRPWLDRSEQLPEPQLLPAPPVSQLLIPPPLLPPHLLPPHPLPPHPLPPPLLPPSSLLSPSLLPPTLPDLTLYNLHNLPTAVPSTYSHISIHRQHRQYHPYRYSNTRERSWRNIPYPVFLA
ncbi:PREDICTED: T-box transcription factor TBX5-A-like isoform X1 [Dinoponera quadriceps]|nr:PREDICTED: T-box transcription factor TBX5-A-like isoform X1 [Dinoponera quadriceps]